MSVAHFNIPTALAALAFRAPAEWRCEQFASLRDAESRLDELAARGCAGVRLVVCGPCGYQVEWR